MIENVVIVFGNDHSNHLGLVRSLGEEGIRPCCVLVGAEKSSSIAWSKYPKEFKFCNSIEEGGEYIYDYYRNEKHKPIILTGGDDYVHYLDINYERFEPYFFFFNAGENGRVTKYMVKDVVSALAEKHGLLIPKTTIYYQGDPFPENITYPCFCKADTSVKYSKKSEDVCYTEDDLRALLRESDVPRILIQDFIKKETEHSYLGFAINHGRDVYVPYEIRYIRFTDKGYGAYNDCLLVEDEAIKNKIRDVMSEIGFEGIFSFEQILSSVDGKWYFTEINFRNDGFAYASTIGGANLAQLYCESVVAGKLITPEKPLKPSVITLDGSVELRLFVRKPIRWLYEWFTADCHLEYNKKDFKPFIRTIMKHITVNFNKINIFHSR